MTRPFLGGTCLDEGTPTLEMGTAEMWPLPMDRLPFLLCFLSLPFLLYVYHGKRGSWPKVVVAVV